MNSRCQTDRRHETKTEDEDGRGKTEKRETGIRKGARDQGWGCKP